ncbi:MAG: hypothetical protein KDE22_03970, partial [Rhodobacterales bacterium]|nr:hypothetical protein [Rhodobacterales bacterium]
GSMAHALADGDPGKDAAIATPTLGGRQFWADRVVTADGWRVQENVVTGHFRLLDGGDRRLAWGDRTHCLAELARHNPGAGAARQGRRVVVLVHGLARSKAAFDRLAPRLRDAGYEALAITYPSTRRSLADHAAQVNGVLDALPGTGRVTFVTHSMGALVVRQALDRPAPWRDRFAVGGLVMAGPPSRGAAAAGALGDWDLYRVLAGPSGQALVPDAATAVPLPRVRHCIIAGGDGGEGFNPWLAGDDDGIVRVDEARLPGSDDFLRVNAIHALLINHPDTWAALRRFLDGGRCNGMG